MENKRNIFNIKIRVHCSGVKGAQATRSKRVGKESSFVIGIRRGLKSAKGVRKRRANVVPRKGAKGGKIQREKKTLKTMSRKKKVRLSTINLRSQLRGGTRGEEPS